MNDGSATATGANRLALGLVEIPSLGLTAVIADRVMKAANVRLLGIETTGNENLMLRLEGDVAAVAAALSFAETTVAAMGAEAIVRCLTRPEPALAAMLDFPNAPNPLYGGRDQFLKTDYPAPANQPMNTKQEALGIIETQGLAAVLEATDTMLKAANVTLVGKEKIGAAYVTVIVRGDVAAVTAAVDAGAKAVGGLGKLIAAHVIARPHDDLIALLPK
ncbi:MAG: BMC domain-containing protein [Verrucomicrobiota bacterium]|nr:BMC domain-containing protein [Limisphaerales bacterium]